MLASFLTDWTLTKVENRKKRYYLARITPDNGVSLSELCGMCSYIAFTHPRSKMIYTQVVNKVKSEQSARSMSTGMEMPGKTTPHLASSIHIL
jgi:hypothetical protein